MEEYSISYETNRMGTIIYKGKKYDLLDQAEFTGRCLDPVLWEGHEEFSALVVDEQGNEFVVYWILPVRDVENLDELDWEQIDRIEER